MVVSVPSPGHEAGLALGCDFLAFATYRTLPNPGKVGQPQRHTRNKEFGFLDVRVVFGFGFRIFSRYSLHSGGNWRAAHSSSRVDREKTSITSLRKTRRIVLERSAYWAPVLFDLES